VPSGNAGATAAVSGAAAPASSSAGVVAASSAVGSAGSIPAAGGHPPHVSPYASAIAVRNWSGPVHEQLEGPGMPVARSVTAHAVALARPGLDGGAGGAGAIGPGGAGGGSGMLMDVVDGADDGAEADDGRVYCWCQMGSYGDMVACDDNECEREWVSLQFRSLTELMRSYVID
jgi:inhibitor of growth protein 3